MCSVVDCCLGCIWLAALLVCGLLVVGFSELLLHDCLVAFPVVVNSVGNHFLRFTCVV